MSLDILGMGSVFFCICPYFFWNLKHLFFRYTLFLKGKLLTEYPLYQYHIYRRTKCNAYYGISFPEVGKGDNS